MLTPLARRWREVRDLPPDAGITLTELIVAMSLMSIVGAMSMSFFIAQNAQTSRTTDASFTTEAGAVAMSAITSTLQLADTPTGKPGYPDSRFLTVAPDSVVFFSNIDPTDRSGSAARTAPVKIAFTAAGSELTESVWRPLSPTVPSDFTTNYASTPTSTLVLLTDLGSTDIFRYCTTTTDPSLSCTPTTTPGSVASVGVTLVLAGLRGETTQTLQSTATITGAVS